jgi:hypothetical protein
LYVRESSSYDEPLRFSPCSSICSFISVFLSFDLHSYSPYSLFYLLSNLSCFIFLTLFYYSILLLYFLLLYLFTLHFSFFSPSPTLFPLFTPSHLFHSSHTLTLCFFFTKSISHHHHHHTFHSPTHPSLLFCVTLLPFSCFLFCQKNQF